MGCIYQALSGAAESRCICVRNVTTDIDGVFTVVADYSWHVCYIWEITLQWRHNGRDDVKKPIASPMFAQPFIQEQIKENFKAPRHWPLCGEFPGDRWIPRTNGQ